MQEHCASLKAGSVQGPKDRSLCCPASSCQLQRTSEVRPDSSCSEDGSDADYLPFDSQSSSDSYFDSDQSSDASVSKRDDLDPPVRLHTHIPCKVFCKLILSEYQQYLILEHIHALVI